MFGSIGTVFFIGILLALNNSCYIALGGVFGTCMPNIPLAMIGATLYAQTTVICAGFFTELPTAICWIRYISPIFYAFKGIVKLAYQWDDTYQCAKGISVVGPNDCFLEQSAMIDDLKQRGINVATFGDPTSSQVILETSIMVTIFLVLQALITLYLWCSSMLRVKEDKSTSTDETTQHTVNIVTLHSEASVHKCVDM